MILILRYESEVSDIKESVIDEDKDIYKRVDKHLLLFFLFFFLVKCPFYISTQRNIFSKKKIYQCNDIFNINDRILENEYLRMSNISRYISRILSTFVAGRSYAARKL